MSLLLLIDGNSLINRAYYAIGSLNAPDGTPTNALFGFTNMLVKMIETLKPTRIASVFDMKAPTFRHKRYAGYKATRKGMPDELAVQMPLLKELLGLMNITCLEKEGYEADDIIGTMAERATEPTVIVTGDRDALQLVSDKTTVHLTKRGITDIQAFTPQLFQETYGFQPIGLVDLKALMGDSSDNIPGVPGVGEKTAMDLMHTYGSLDAVYAHLDEQKGALKAKLENGKESAYLSYELATIDRHVPIECAAEQLEYDFPFSKEVQNKFQFYSFRQLAAREKLFSTASTVVEESAEKVTARTARPSELDGLVGDRIALWLTEDDLYVATDCVTQFCVHLSQNLLDEGTTLNETFSAFKALGNDKIKKTVFDAKVLYHRFKRCGGDLTGVDFDVQLAQYVADCTVVNDALGALLAANGLSGYVSTPAVALWRLQTVLETKLESFRKLFYDIEMPLQAILYRMEERGIKVDVEKLDSAGKKLLTECEQLSQTVTEIAGHSFNLNSPKQIGTVLFEELGLAGGKKTKQKNYSTSADVLENLRGEPIVDALLRYRTLNKLYSTYVEGIKKQLTSDHLIHTIYKQNVTLTGRLSSAEPNLQNIPVRVEEGKTLRRMFVAREGFEFISADYSQIELRLLAHFSGEEDLIEAYRHGEDIHRTTASHVFNVPLNEVTSLQRREAKTVNFGVIYGISDFGLSKNLGISVSKARKYILGYFMRYPKVKAYLDKQIELARRDKKLSTTFGRVRRFENINSSNFSVRSFNERAAMNMPLQATAADLIKIAMIRVDHALKASGADAYLLLQVHDELIVEAKKEDVEAAGRILKREMENAMELKVPLIVDLSVGETWYDL